MLLIRCTRTLFLLAILTFLCTVTSKTQTLLLVKKPDNQITIQPENYKRKSEEKIIAYGTYKNDINNTGWGHLEIRTSGKCKDSEQAYGAGYLEGILTADLIYSHWYNTVGDFCTDQTDSCNIISDYLTTNKNWIKSKINDSWDPYWYHVGLYYKQLEGLHDGYMHGKSSNTPDLTWEDIFKLNALDDLGDLVVALNSSETNRKVLGSGSCSALIKLMPKNEDMFVSHVTWSGYQMLLKIKKKYSLQFKKSASSKTKIRGMMMSFSSFPGGIQSGDDFYLISSGMATLETTIENYNNSLWSNVKPVGQVLEFIRAMVANRLAINPNDWINLFKKHNSGTYNNQWMIVNYAEFQPRNPLPTKNLFHVLEQMPGFIVHADLTEHLINQTYWASYNVPYFPFIFNISGHNIMEQYYGKWFSYSDTPRARIFARDHVKIQCDKSMLNLMLSNDFQHDPESKCDCNPPYTAANAISARNDLNPENGTYPIESMGHMWFGATDVKITTSKLFQNLKFKAIAGPTQGTNNSLGPFCWSKSNFSDQVRHLDQPDCFDFKPVL